jgi:hypothetical protein
MGPDGFEIIEILTGRRGFTVIATVFEVAGLPVVQMAFDTKTQEIKSLFNNDASWYDEELVPIFIPFFFH